MQSRTAIVASVGLGLTVAATVVLVPSLGRALPQVIALPAALFVVFVSPLLPDSAAGKYDPVGHPVLWFLGLGLTFAMAAFALFTLARAFRKSGAGSSSRKE